MKSLISKTIITLTALICFTLADVSDFNGKCVSCVLNSASNYYCTATNECVSTYKDNASCEKGLQVCLSYKSVDLGIKEIAPFNKTVRSFNYTISSGDSVRFAISNQDSKQKGYVEVQLAQSENGALLKSAPSQFEMYQYNPTDVNSSLTKYIFSDTGKTTIKPLNTNFYMVGANNGPVHLVVTYGNKKNNAVRIVSVWSAIFLLLLSYFSF